MKKFLNNFHRRLTCLKIYEATSWLKDPAKLFKMGIKHFFFRVYVSSSKGDDYKVESIVKER